MHVILRCGCYQIGLCFLFRIRGMRFGYMAYNVPADWIRRKVFVCCYNGITMNKTVSIWFSDIGTRSPTSSDYEDFYLYNGFSVTWPLTSRSNIDYRAWKTRSESANLSVDTRDNTAAAAAAAAADVTVTMETDRRQRKHVRSWVKPFNWLNIYITESLNRQTNNFISSTYCIILLISQSVKDDRNSTVFRLRRNTSMTTHFWRKVEGCLYM